MVLDPSPPPLLSSMHSHQRLLSSVVLVQPIPREASFSKAQSSKLERLFCHDSVKRDVRALSFELCNSIRKCHPKWDWLYTLTFELCSHCIPHDYRAHLEYTTTYTLTFELCSIPHDYRAHLEYTTTYILTFELCSIPHDYRAHLEYITTLHFM